MHIIIFLNINYFRRCLNLDLIYMLQINIAEDNLEGDGGLRETSGAGGATQG